jgi:hypothetical protein
METDFLEKFEKLPKDIREYLSGNDSRLAIEQACFSYAIKEEDMEKMALPVLDIFFRDIPLEKLPLIVERELHVDDRIAYGIAYEMNQKMFGKFGGYFTDAAVLLNQWKSTKVPSLVSEEKAWQQVVDAEPWISEQEEEEKQQMAETQAKTEEIAVEDALKKYPNFGEQAVSGNLLKLKYFPTPVKPSIKNWITDFHDNMGAGKHSSIDRANYLFHSDNGKKLTPMERRKLSLILKSLEEQTPMSIDTATQAIILSGSEQELADEEQQPIISSQPPAFGNQQRFAVNYKPRPVARFAANEEQKDVFQKYSPSSQKQEFKSGFSPNFASKEFSKNTVQANKPVEKNETRRNFFRISESKPKLENDNYFSNFASAPEKKISSQDFVPAKGTVSFSSAQKLPVEQNMDSVKTNENPIKPPTPVQTQPPSQPQIDKPQVENAPESQKPVYNKSKWHIEPTKSPYDEYEDKKNGNPKIIGNIIDLRG